MMIGAFGPFSEVYLVSFESAIKCQAIEHPKILFTDDFYHK